jgi:molybdopterin molybdotransferase
VITVPEAVDRLLAAVAPLPAVEAPWDAALGLTLAADVRADRDAPPSDRSAMDGFAVRSPDLAGGAATLRIAGEVRAGESGEGVHVAPGTCARVFTGAVIPEGADAVVMVERTVEDRAAGAVRVEEAAPAGRHVRRRGEDRRAGEIVVARGTVLRPAEIAALAAVGSVRVPVVPRPEIAVASTGDEIVEVDRLPGPHEIRNSNAAMLLALLEREGMRGRFLGIARDEPAALDALLDRGLAHDVLLLTGGVSVGEHDLVAPALARRGAAVLFHTVAMRPGKPILAARCGRALVLGLPGNPVSAFTAFHVFAAPALRRLAGDPHPMRASAPARLLERLPRRPGRRTYALASLARRDGGLVATPVRSASSGDVFALARANAFVVVEGGEQPIEAGEPVDVLPWDDVPTAGDAT